MQASTLRGCPWAHQFWNRYRTGEAVGASALLIRPSNSGIDPHLFRFSLRERGKDMGTQSAIFEGRINWGA